MHQVGLITRKCVTMHGHMKVKLVTKIDLTVPRFTFLVSIQEAPDFIWNPKAVYSE